MNTDKNKNDNIISFRVDPHKKKMLLDRAKENDLKLSEYVKAITLDYLDQLMLLDTQNKLREFITESVTDANELQFHKILTTLNRIIIGMETLITQNDITYNYFDLPTRISDYNKHIDTHPVTEIARRIVLQSFQKEIHNKHKKITLFSDDIFNTLIDKIIIGEVLDDGTEDLYRIKFILKTGEMIVNNLPNNKIKVGTELGQYGFRLKKKEVQDSSDQNTVYVLDRNTNINSCNFSFFIHFYISSFFIMN